MKYDSLPEFERDFKKLLKRFRTLEEDFANLKKHHMELLHLHSAQLAVGAQPNDPVKIRANNICAIYKVRKFACKSLKNKGSQTGLRVIYAYQAKLEKITFIEIYFKGDKENEDYERIKNFLASM